MIHYYILILYFFNIINIQKILILTIERLIVGILCFNIIFLYKTILNKIIAYIIVLL